MPARYDATRDDLAALLDGEPGFRVRQVWEGLHSRFASPSEMTELPQALRVRLDAELPAALTLEHESVSDGGDTVKWLWRLHDGTLIETVLMHYSNDAEAHGRDGVQARSRDGVEARSRDRTTVCISTQAGCAMACGFCATGQAGFERNLSTGEIVEQVVHAARAAMPRRVTNVVFMGMGEPMANYDRTWAAVRRMHDDIGISARHLTISTVGIIPGIKRLATESLPVNLAVSLHAANDTLRDELVPINKRYPLAKLRDACEEYLAAKGRRLSFEWALIDGVNDRDIDAKQLAQIARDLHAHVNLIPLNPTPGYLTRGTPTARVRAFRDLVKNLGANATVRQNRGTSIDAACGQLRATSVTLTHLERGS